MSVDTADPTDCTAPAIPDGVADAMLAGEPIRVLAQLPVQRLTALQDAAALLGGRLELAQARRSGDGIAGTDAVWLIEAATLAQLTVAERERVRARTAGAHVLIFCADEDAAGALPAAAAALSGRELPTVSGGEEQAFTIAGDVAALEPFGGLTLREDRPRSLPLLIDPDPRGVRPLITSAHGAALAEVRREDGGHVWVSTVPPLTTLAPGAMLRRHFHPGDFLELLPLLAFLRDALSDRGWRRPHTQAAFMIDDPNLRSGRYGWVDYAALRDAGARHRFHTSIAMAAIDAGKTSRATAAMFRESPELSLVMHGIYHTHHEFARSVPERQARRDLSFGLAQMERHRSRHGVSCPPVMTFPFSRCSSEWLQAMRDVGLAAAVTGPNPFPFLSEFGMLADPALGMLPAEMGHGGFPVLTRSFLTQPREDLLFAAWLGRPLIVYLHHEDLRNGVTPLVEIAEFVNRHLDAEWTDLGRIVQANYQVRTTAQGPVVRAFSGRVALTGDEGDPVALFKPGADRHRDETVWADGRRLVERRLDGVGMLAALPAGARSILTGPAAAPPPGARRALGGTVAHGRRGLTEVRDRLAPTVARLLRDRGPARPDPPGRFPAFTG